MADSGTGLAAAGTPVTASGTAHSDPVMREVARHVLGSGAPGFVARIDDGRRTAVTAAGVADRRTGRPLGAPRAAGSARALDLGDHRPGDAIRPGAADRAARATVDVATLPSGPPLTVAGPP